MLFNLLRYSVECLYKTESCSVRLAFNIQPSSTPSPALRAGASPFGLGLLGMDGFDQTDLENA